MDPGGWGGGQAGGHEYPVADPHCLSFNEEHLGELIQDEDLEGVDFYLSAFFRLEDPEAPLLEAGADQGILNPSLMLHVRGEELLSRIREGNQDGAQSFYNQWILPLRNLHGPRVPYSDFVRMRVDSLGDRMHAEDGSSDWPNQQAKDLLMGKILDYIRLYYRGAIGHNMVTDGRRQPLWNFSMIWTDVNNEQIQVNGKWMYRCLACNDWDAGRYRGIKQLEYHLVGNREGRNLPCPMATPRLFELMGVPDPYIVPDADNDEPNILPAENNQVPIPNNQDEVAEAAANQAMEDQLDEVDEVAEAAANQAMGGQLGGAVVVEGNQDANAPARPPQGFIEASTVLYSHGRISPQLDPIVRSLANEPLPAINPLASRVRLQKIRTWCIQATYMGGWEVVDAHNVLTEVQETRNHILKMLDHLYSVRPALRHNFHTMLNEIDTLEERCFAATAPHVP